MARGPLAFLVQEHMAGSSPPETLSPYQTMHAITSSEVKTTLISAMSGLLVMDIRGRPH